MEDGVCDAPLLSVLNFLRPLIVLVLFVGTTAGAIGEGVDGFPNWAERVEHEWMNRARCDPQVEMQRCGAPCIEGACYQPVAPLTWSLALNHAARYHSNELSLQGYFAHDSACTIVSNIDTLFPASCDGAAGCGCVGGVKACSPTCTPWNARVGLFGGGAAGEIIASGRDPDGAFYQWLYEGSSTAACGYNSANGHRYNILMSGPSIGVGVGVGPSVGDFGGPGEAASKIPSGSHYPRQADPVEVWANWADTAAPTAALVNVDGACTPMTLQRGSGTNGAWSTSITGAGSGCHRYFFTFKDSAGAVVTFPTTGSLGMGATASCPDWDPARPASGAGCNCVPACGGQACGDDGCGGSCGACTSGSCQAGQCVGAPDAGSDAGSSADAGTTSDAGSPSDAGSSADGGRDNAMVTGACGCSPGGPRSSLATWLLLVLSWWRLGFGIELRKGSRRPRRSTRSEA